MNSKLAWTFLALGLACPASGQTVKVLGAVKDNTLYQDAAGGLSNGQGAYLFAGSTNLGAARRGLIAFDVAAGIPPGSKILSASLTLHMSKTIAGSVPVALHRLEADWGEGASKAPSEEGGGGPAAPGDATWLHRFHPGTLWTARGGDFAPTASAVVGVGGIGPWTWASTPALVADVQGWLDNPGSNYGWLILASQTGTTAKRFDSRENPAPALRPRLAVGFQAPQASVTPLGQGCAGSSGKPFRHGANGLPVLGNSLFALEAAAGPAGGVALFLLGAAPAAVPLPVAPGCLLQVDPFGFLLLLPSPLDPAGAASQRLPIPADPWFAFVTLYTQALALDPPAPGGLVVSGGLRLFLAP